jgi:hypothetical protein
LIKRGTSVNLLVSDIIGLMQARSFISAAFILVFIFVPSLRGAEVSWPVKLGSWTAAGSPAASSGQAGDMQQVPVLRESGLVSLSSQNYKDGGESHKASLYLFHDSSGAYEGYTLLRGLGASMNSPHTILVASNLVLWIDGGLSAEQIDQIQTWEKHASDHIPSPPIAKYLPDQNKDPLSERYALGPVGFRVAAKELGQADAAGLVDTAGFNSGAEAMFARYKTGKDEATLLLIEYPTPQLAELHLRHLQRALSADKKSGSSVERKGSLLSIILGPTSAAYAEKLRGAVNYETEVTWNEPSTTATDPPITSTLVKIIIATMVLMVMALVLGIAFGGVRIITKRLFPGKVFDRPARMEVLQLGLSGKPIDPRDMY